MFGPFFCCLEANSFSCGPCGGEGGWRGCIRSCSMKSMQFVKVFCIMHLLLGSGWLEQSFGFGNVGASLQCFIIYKPPSGPAHARSFGLRDPLNFFPLLFKVTIFRPPLCWIRRDSFWSWRAHLRLCELLLCKKSAKVYFKRSDLPTFFVRCATTRDATSRYAQQHRQERPWTPIYRSMR